jgi:hypothetical protein
VLGTRTARLGHPFLECFPGSEHSHTSVARGQSLLLSERLNRCARDLNCFECLGVFWLQSRGETGHARADLRLQLLAGRLSGVELARECFVRSVSCAAPPKLIDGGVSKVAIEPDQNACDENPTGAVTRNVLVNDIRLVQNTTTPGNGDEPGFAFTIAPNGTVSQ